MIARAKPLELNTPYVPPPGDPLEHNTSGYAKTIVPTHDLVVVRIGHYKGERPGSEAFKKALAILMEAVPRKAAAPTSGGQ